MKNLFDVEVKQGISLLSNKPDYLTFYFTAITQDQPWKVQYQYKIDEINWHC